jgi:hypothetical protein
MALQTLFERGLRAAMFRAMKINTTEWDRDYGNLDTSFTRLHKA